jgi:UDP-N-acetylmuramoyl-tripeptide--D-alanyl-D-alanine ligase
MSVDWTVGHVRELVRGELLGDGEDVRLSGVETDSRRIKPGELFVALSGERYDGADYVADAAAKGASAALVGREVPEEIPQIHVADTLEALRVLGRARRREFRGPVVAVTGSCGKTTTKDLIAAVLSRKYRVRVSPENYNNEVGVPLSILSLEDGDEALVLELGVSAPGDMAPLGDAVEPSVAVLTNVAQTHLEFFGAVEGVRREKMALLNYVKPGGTAVLNADDPLVAAMVGDVVNGLKVVTFGLGPGADVTSRNTEALGFEGSRFTIFDGVEAALALPGEYNVLNALAAAAVGQVLGVPPEDIAAGLGSYVGRDLRAGVEVDGRGVTYFVDCYNSSPHAARAALAFFATLSGARRRIAVLGEMLELGEARERAHREVGAFAGEVGLDMVVGLGEGGGWIVEGARAAGLPDEAAVAFANKEEVVAYLKKETRTGDAVLMKASRGVRLEEVLNGLGIEI